MAATGYTPLSLYYSATATNTPTAPNLVNGELAINITDGKLYYKDNTGVVQVLATKAATSGVFAKVTANGSTTASANSGAFNYGTLSYSDTNILASYASSVNAYNQMVLQNASNGAAASTNFNVSNDSATTSTNFGEFGINSSGFTGTGAFSAAGNVYLAAASTDLAIGTYGANAIHFVVNSGATDALTIASTGIASFPTTGAVKLPAGTTAQQPTGVTGMIRFNSDNTAFEGYNGTAWSSIGGGSTISNDTATASNRYPLFAAATSGSATTIYTSNAKYLYKPSTGELQASALVASNGLVVNANTVATSYSIPSGSNAMSVGPITVASGQTVTVPSGSRYVIL